MRKHIMLIAVLVITTIILSSIFYTYYKYDEEMSFIVVTIWAVIFAIIGMLYAKIKYPCHHRYRTTDKNNKDIHIYVHGEYDEYPKQRESDSPMDWDVDKVMNYSTKHFDNVFKSKKKRKKK